MSGIRDIWLYANNIIRSARQMVNEDLQSLDLSSAEGNVLLHILTQKQTYRQEDIGEQLDVSKPAVSRAIASLAGKGYVTREKDPADRRASRILLTEKARAIGPRVERIYNEAYFTATRVLSEQEVEEFIELFGRVSESFSTALAEKRGRWRAGSC
ncbi:MAG: MarR family transcriptional regulator [bacterium]|nr:MarR family transcriptional regulator [bacterium]